ncbi:MAG: Ig-like domain-containing protein, partial [Patescibacteria group bacterium]
MDEISRKLLSHDSTYTVPYSLDGFPYDTFDSDITLQVDASEYKTISSVIIHNEPTDFTISEQLKSQTAFSLPIDNPRYVAFQSKPKLMEPEGQYYYPGKTQKINYVNLFGPDGKNPAQLMAALTVKAGELAAVPGSYRIFGENAEESDYTPKQISDKILDDYLAPVVSDTLDDPVQGFNLKTASSAKIYDALKWLDLNIDEKHEYILQYYLNGDSKTKGNAYVNDSTLLPAPEGFEPAYGYEAAYLVLNGEKNYSDMAFNKDLPEETDTKFDPLSQELGAEEEWPEGEPPDDEEGGGGDGDFEFVWIQDWLKELEKFIDSVTSVPDFEAGCAEGFGDEGDGKEGEGAVEENAEFNQNLEVDADASDVHLFSYVYTDIEGFDELEAAIESGMTEAEWTGEGVEGETMDSGSESVGGAAGIGENVGGIGESGGGSEGTGGAGGGEVGETLEGDEVTGEIGADLGGTDAGSETGGSGSGGDGTTEGGTGASGEGGIGEIGTGLGGTDAGSGIDESGDGGDGAVEDESGSNLEILESKPVEETTLESTPVETEPTEDSSQPKIEKEQTWEEYFMLKKYYQKFLNQNAKTSHRGWLAAAFSDNPFVDSDSNDESKYIIDTGDSMIADDQSLMKIDAEIFDTNGKLEVNKILNVKFSLSKNLVSFDGNNVVKSKNGIATVYLKAGKKAGDFKIKAEVIKADGSVDKNYKIPQKDLHLLAGDPAKIEIKSDSYALVANGQSKTTLNFILKDKFGNIANDSFSQVVVFVDGNATIDEKADTNKKMIGVQLSTFDGKATMDLTAKDQAGESNVVAFVLDPLLEKELLSAGDDWGDIDFTQYIGTTKKFQILDKVTLSLKVFDENFQETNSIVADGKSIARLGLKLLHNGQTLTEYSGPIKFNIINGNIGSFVNEPSEKLANGELNPANVTFKSSTLAGEEEILVDVPGFVTDSFKFKTTHGTPKTIELTASQNSINTNSQNEV